MSIDHLQTQTNVSLTVGIELHFGGGRKVYWLFNFVRRVKPTMRMPIEAVHWFGSHYSPFLSQVARSESGLTSELTTIGLDPDVSIIASGPQFADSARTIRRIKDGQLVANQV